MSQPVPVPNIEFTLRQIVTLNGIVTELHSQLPSEGGVAGADSHAVLDPVANEAIRSVIVAGCNRIEQIILDRSRWELKGDSHETLVQIAQMEREIMKSRVLSENLGRHITKLQVFGPQLLAPEVPDVRATPTPAPAEPVKPATVKPKRKKRK